MEVIDDDKRLWKAFLWQDFKWQKAPRRGKGRAKKNRKDCVYQRQYATLYRQRRVALDAFLSSPDFSYTVDNKMAELKGKKRQLLEQQRKVKTAKLLQKVELLSPFDCSKVAVQVSNMFWAAVGA
jgi:hypothetical protein